jgi:hypothetical protein
VNYQLDGCCRLCWGVVASIYGRASRERREAFVCVDQWRFPPKVEGESMERDVAIGSDGTRGSGLYWANWDGEVFSPNKKLENIRVEGRGGECSAAFR